MSNAGLAAGVVGVTGVHARVEGENPRLGAFADDQREAVGQHLDGDSLFKTCQVLGAPDCGGNDRYPV